MEHMVAGEQSTGPVSCPTWTMAACRWRGTGSLFSDKEHEPQKAFLNHFLRSSYFSTYHMHQKSLTFMLLKAQNGEDTLAFHWGSPQLWRNSKCQHGNRRRSRVWEKCRDSMHTVASKDIPSTVIPSFLQSPDEGQMSTPSFMPSMDSRCTARSFRQKSFTIFMSKESPDQLCAGLWWSVLLSQWSKTMQSILQLAYWGTMICVFNK